MDGWSFIRNKEIQMQVLSSSGLSELVNQINVDGRIKTKKSEKRREVFSAGSPMDELWAMSHHYIGNRRIQQ